MSQQSSHPGYDVYTRAPSGFNSKAIEGAIIVIFLVVFFIFMLHVYAKWFFQRSSRSSAISRSSRSYPIYISRSSRSYPIYISGYIAFVSSSAVASADINTGLDKAAITQLPTFVYKATSNLEAGKLDESVMRLSLQCAVCLSEFQENEKGRMLPSCKHTFHTECIDMWLFSHSTCPLCRTKVVPAMATSPSTAYTHEQQHEEEEQEAMEPLPRTTEGSPVVSTEVEYPRNVQFWGNQTQAVLLQEPSSSSLPLSLSVHMSGARALPQITIEIPPIEGNLLECTSRPLSAKCTTEQEDCSSQPLNFRASIKRMLSRQCSRHKSSSQEAFEGSPK